MAQRSAHLETPATIRRRWRVRGQVQGVGFRPFVWRLARAHDLTGLIRNDCDGVMIEVQGAADAIDEMERELRQRRPALASITDIRAQDVPSVAAEREFRIEASDDATAPRADVTVDAAACPACVAELLGETDRRRGYGLINCTECGPRYSIVKKVPYDRPNTTMAGFAMCARCRAEYENPADRRYHAQPIACHDCGPKVTLVDPAGRAMEGDPVREAARMLLDGRVLAIKGLGGFHLACRADDKRAVARLRKLKHRDAKPFAVMCASVEQARELAELSAAGEAALASAACPIVLARKRAGARVAEGVAPGNHRLGVMVAYTPVQHLLFGALESARPVSTPALSDSTQTGMPVPPSESPGFGVQGSGFGVQGWGRGLPLVMTSGNLSDEPLVIENGEAIARLGMLCDAMLWHDRPIERCVDDSVVIDWGEPNMDTGNPTLAASPLPIRRARGYVPTPIPLPVDMPTMGLCVGAELKNTVAVVRGNEAILSQHLGDLSHPLALEYFKRHVRDLCELFGVRPRWVAHDLHPLYQSLAHAHVLAEAGKVEMVGVQHHHAHAAAVMAEHAVTEKILAVVCDGVGYGEDGTSWGGELLLADLAGYERVGHLGPMLLAGGDAAAKDTRRCGLALLQLAYGEAFAAHPMAARLVAGRREREILCQMLRRGLNCTPSSGAGRVFDGVAAMLGLCERNEFEAQAAMALEAVASGQSPVAGDQELFAVDSELKIDLGPLVRWIAGGVCTGGAPVPQLAAVFHEQFARAWAAAAWAAAQKTGVTIVGLSGGVFCNEILTRRLTELLEARGLRVLRHRVVPPNDGGISLGQAAVAAWRVGNRKAGA